MIDRLGNKNSLIKKTKKQEDDIHDDEVAGNTIPTNLRLLRILEVMAQMGVPVTPTELVQPLGLPKPTVHRLFSTLEQNAYVQNIGDNRGFVLGQRARSLSANILSSLSLHTARIAILTRLADHIGETCNIAQPDRNSMIYLERVETKWPLRIQLTTGSKVPLYCTASGKLYLSTLDTRQFNGYLSASSIDAQTPSTITSTEELSKELKKIRRNGYSTDNEEFIAGMIAVAVPVWDSTGRLFSTLSFHAPILRIPLKKATTYIPILNQAAQELQKLIE